MIALRKKEGGSIALILVLITLALMTVIVNEILYRAKVAATVVTNRRDSEKAYQLAKAAVRWSIFRLQLDNSLDQIQDIPNTNYGGKKDDLTEVQWAVPLPYPLTGAALGKAMDGDTKDAGKTSDDKEKNVARASELGGSFVSSITDESSKINLNDVSTAGFGGQRQPSAAMEILENLLLSPRFARFFKNNDHRGLLWAIDDWTDADSEVNHLGGGIEDAEYQTDDKDLHVKNGAFYSLEEIRMLKPMTDDLFRELKPFVTVYPFDAKTLRTSQMVGFPQGRINVNTAPLEIIAAVFSKQALAEPKARLECALNVVKFRKNVVFRSVRGKNPSFLEFVQKNCGVGDQQQQQQQQPQGGGAGAPAVSNIVMGILSVRSDIFSVEATGLVNDVQRTIETVITRQDAQKPKPLFWKVI